MALPERIGKVLKLSWVSQKAPVEFAEDLNDIYCRFNQRDFCLERSALNTEILDQSGFVSNISVQIEDVERVFKGSGPDKVSGRLLKTCFRELSGVFCDLINQSLKKTQHPEPSGNQVSSALFLKLPIHAVKMTFVLLP